MKFFRKRVFKYFIFLVFYVFILFFLFHHNQKPQEIISDKGSIEVFFCQRTNCSYLLDQFIEENNNTVCAFYDLENSDVIKRLINYKVPTKIFVKNFDHLKRNNFEGLKDILIEKNYSKIFRPVKSKGLMHNKFCANNDFLLTGSWNPTFRGTYKNDNYVVLVRSKVLSSNYKKDFFTIDNDTKAEKVIVNLSGILIENYFCPENNCEKQILRTISSANKSIKILAFSFTSKNIASALVEKEKEDINISVLFEKSRISKYSAYNLLKENNITVFLDSNPFVMHEKVFIIDDSIVILGSYNPTNAANKLNDENILIIHNKNISSEFTAEFHKLTMI